MNRLRVALIGAGRMSRIRAKILYANPRVELVCVVDVVESMGKALAADYNTKYFKSLDEFFASGLPALHAVVISTPTFTHGLLVEQASKAGLAIFTEKPVAETSEDTEKLFAIAKKHNVSLCCGFQRRFDKNYVALKQAVAAGKVGTPIMVRVFFADHPCPPIEFLKTGGDPFMDLSPHDVDFVRWVLDDEPVEVFGSGSSSSEVLKEANVLDNATMYIKFKRGAICTIMMSRGATYGYDQRCEVFGDKGIVSIENVAQTTCVVGDSTGFHHDRLQYSFPQRFAQGFEDEISTFVAHCLDKVPWPITESDCCRVQAIADAGMRSCKEGKMMYLSADKPAFNLKPIGAGGFGSYMMDEVMAKDPQRAELVTSVLKAFTRSSGDSWKDTVLDSKDVHATYICSPDHMHQEHAAQCLSAGKHVLVEKPVTPSFEDVLTALDKGKEVLGSKRPPVLYVGFHRRFDAEFLRAKEYVKSGKKIQTVIVESRDPVPADDRMEFVLANSCCHDVDMLNWLFPKSKITFTKGNFAKENTSINLWMDITLQDGSTVKGEIRYSKVNPTYVQRVTLNAMTFGYEFTPRPNVTCCELFVDAYRSQFATYLAEARAGDARKESEQAEKERLAGYAQSFAYLKDAAKVLF